MNKLAYGQLDRELEWQGLGWKIDGAVDEGVGLDPVDTQVDDGT